MKDFKNLSDEKLAELVCNQDQELYRTLVKRYQEKLLRYANYFVRDEDKAADIVQSAFIKAFINLKGFNVKKKFSSWLYRIVHNEAINFIKKYKKEISLEDNLWIEKQIKDKNNIEAEFALRDINKPIGVSEFELTEILPDNLKNSLPTIEEFEEELNELLDESMTKNLATRDSTVEGNKNA